jgi:prephenate dehydratase
MRVAFQGETGAFSEDAVRALFPTSEPIPFLSFDAVFEAVASGEVDRGVIPIENSLFGSVHANYDLLQSNDLWITDEISVRIRHHLMGLPGTRLEDIRKVYSHPQALGQCSKFLRERLSHVEAIPAYDTAGSAKMIASRGERDAGAIASLQAAREYGLEILAHNIENNQHNYTRFLALARKEEGEPSVPEGPAKTSIVYAMRENVPGALFKSLAVFALRDLDLYKIESRPLIGSPGNYLFYLDLQGSIGSDVVQRAIEHLREIAAFVRVLGSYPIGRMLD